jgi:uncharacterized protein (DUF1697 family)
MHHSYLALLRGINVGGKNMIKMADLKACLEQAGFKKVRTYIQSGNVLFESAKSDTAQLARSLEQTIEKQFGVPVGVAVFEKKRWQAIVDKAPAAWGSDQNWKHNLLVLLEPYDMKAVVADIGELKPDIEMLVPGDGVLYQSLSLKLFGRTTTGKLASKPVYKRMTIRNYNTAVKLLALL